MYYTNKSMPSLHPNIGKLYLLSAMRMAAMFMAVMIPFLQSIGLTSREYFFLIGFFSFLVVVLEIPSGYLSDRWGRKRTLLTGSIAASIGIVLWSTSYGFWQYLLGEVFWAIGYSFFSGTTDAMLYDSLLEKGEEKHFRSVTAKSLRIKFTIQALLSIAGGFVAARYGLRSTYWISVPFIMSTIPISLSLREPLRHKIQEERHLSAMISIMRTVLIQDHVLRMIILLSAILVTISMTLVFITQPFQDLIHFPLQYFGIPHAIGLLGVSAASKMTPLLQKRFHDHVLLTLIMITTISSMIIAGLQVTLLGLLIILMGRSVFGILDPLSQDMINQRTRSDIRATTLSIRSFLVQILFVVITLILGGLSNVYSLTQMMVWIGVVSGIVSIGLLFNVNRYTRK